MEPTLYDKYIAEIIVEDRLAKERAYIFDMLVRYNVQTVKLRNLAAQPQKA